MTADPTSDGVLLTELRQIIDDRGAVLHHFRCDDPEFTKFGESYFSEMVPGAVKAWKRHRQQTQNLTVPIGRVRFAIRDDREDSPTRGTVIANCADLPHDPHDAELRLQDDARIPYSW